MTGNTGDTLARGLRRTSDSLIATLDELYALEDEKRALAPGTERFVELAKRIESLAGTVLAHTQRQESLAQESAAVKDRGEAVPAPIDDIPPRGAAAILTEWRAAERRLGEVADDSPEADRLASDIRRLRAEYRRAVARVQGDNAEGPHPAS